MTREAVSSRRRSERTMSKVSGRLEICGMIWLSYPISTAGSFSVVDVSPAYGRLKEIMSMRSCRRLDWRRRTLE